MSIDQHSQRLIQRAKRAPRLSRAEERQCISAWRERKDRRAAQRRISREQFGSKRPPDVFVCNVLLAKLGRIYTKRKEENGKRVLATWPLSGHLGTKDHRHHFSFTIEISGCAFTFVTVYQ